MDANSNMAANGFITVFENFKYDHDTPHKLLYKHAKYQVDRTKTVALYSEHTDKQTNKET